MMKFTAKSTIEKVADSLMDSLMISSTTYMPPPSKDQSKHRHHQSGVLTSLFSQLGNAKTERLGEQRKIKIDRESPMAVLPKAFGYATIR